MNNKITLRNANRKDVLLFFNWTNDPEVRANSLSTNIINWEEHLNWFNSKIRDVNSKLYVFEIRDKPVGQIRIEKTNANFHLINFSIDKKERGKGYGKKILISGMDQYIKHLNKNTKFKAVVKEDNKASSLIFEYLEFNCFGNFELNKKIYLEYIKEVSPENYQNPYFFE